MVNAACTLEGWEVACCRIAKVCAFHRGQVEDLLLAIWISYVRDCTAICSWALEVDLWRGEATRAKAEFCFLVMRWDERVPTHTRIIRHLNLLSSTKFCIQNCMQLLDRKCYTAYEIKRRVHRGHEPLPPNSLFALVHRRDRPTRPTRPTRAERPRQAR